MSAGSDDIPAGTARLDWQQPLRNPTVLIALGLLMWLPLLAYVLFEDGLGDFRKFVLLPAIPATLALYLAGLLAWRGSWIAILGLT